METYKTEQENFWAGAFGSEYTERNYDEEGILVANNTALFSRMAKITGEWSTVLELGANRGMNLKAIKHLFPKAKITAVEINPIAAKHLESIASDVFVGSIFDFTPPPLGFNFVLIKGVLIHIDPGELQVVYEKLSQSSNRYVCICEYYNPSPVEVPYRGHKEKLFKRDFAGEFMDRYPEFRLVDYGFVYHRDPVFPQDDMNWFLLEKK